MALTFSTLLAGAVLGGGLAARITVIVAIAIAALVVIALANGAVLMRRVMSLYED